MSLKIFHSLILPALVLGTPATLIAAPQTPTHEVVRSGPGKTVMLWRPVNRDNSAAIKCHPDPTKAFLCHGRSAPEGDLASSARPERLSER